MALNHVMIDLETLGTKSNSVILSIGAVQFSLSTGEIGKKFYSNINLDSSIDAGLKICPDTLQWWLSQSEQAKAKAFGSSGELDQDLGVVLQKFNAYLQKNRAIVQKEAPLYVWGNSNRFDLGLLANAYESFDKDLPWDFRNERDVRTLVHYAPSIKEDQPFIGTAHNPVDDCLHQIKYCVKIHKLLTNN